MKVKGTEVESMFAGIAGRYDAANHLLSGGIDWYWRYRLVRRVRQQAPRSVADLATGSGDVAFALRRKLPPEVPIDAMDFCEPMLDEARRKQANSRTAENLSFRFGDCLQLPLENDSVDAITIAFGLRNLEDRPAGLREMHRVLDPERGCLYVLEFTQPDAWFRPVYTPYLRYVLPRIAKIATGDKAAYDYLVGSIDAFPDKSAISQMILEAGFSRVTATGLTGSAVALHQAWA
jgi:demethylmenaquinone methyltransferase/2-methoxy-6-polyprenyl-1,4-benzoquinol methylase